MEHIIVHFFSIFLHVMLYKRDIAEEKYKQTHKYYDEVYCSYLNQFPWAISSSKVKIKHQYLYHGIKVTAIIIKNYGLMLISSYS